MTYARPSPSERPSDPSAADPVGDAVSVEPSAAAYIRGVEGALSAATERLTDGWDPLEQDGQVRAWLAAHLPGRYGAVAGTVVSSNPKMRALPGLSSLIVDRQAVPPGFALSDGMVPIELVAGAVEVLADLTPVSLAAAADRLAQLRKIAKRGKYYTSYVGIKKPNGKILTTLREVRVDQVPRLYVVARDTGLDRLEAVTKLVRELFPRDEEQELNGLLVLGKGWLFYHPEHKTRLDAITDRATLRFVHKLSVDLAGIETHPLALQRYLDEA